MILLQELMPNTNSATMFLTSLNGLHPSLSFTMELPVDDRIPLIGIEIIKNGTKLETQVYRKPTNTGLLLHFYSHTDKRYKNSLRDLSNKIGLALQPVFVSKKFEQDLKPKEAKPSIVNQQCVVYHFVCDRCDADYVGYTTRHLFQRVAEHKNSAIGKHFHEAHGMVGGIV